MKPLGVNSVVLGLIRDGAIPRAAQPLGDAHSWLITQVAASRVVVEPVCGGQVPCHEPGHRGLVGSSRQEVGRFEHAADGNRHRAGDRSFDRSQVGGLEQKIDHIPGRNGLALRDKIGPARDWRARVESVGGLEMGLDGVVNVDRIDDRVAIPDFAEAAGLGAGDDAREKIVVAGSPDQVRTNRHGRQAFRVGFEDHLLGDAPWFWGKGRRTVPNTAAIHRRSPYRDP